MFDLKNIFMFSLLAVVSICEESNTYIAAVVEYASITSPEDSRIESNVEKYVEFIKSAAEQNVSIIVFPEIGLTGLVNAVGQEFVLVPDPEDAVTPCTDDDYGDTLIKTLSCEAKNNQIYVVVNVPEQFQANKTTILHYNTNVIFDRSGTVIIRYRKYNLFGEVGMNVPEEPGYAYFTSDFGVTFGTFICFDILFEVPTLKLIREHGVTDVLFSTAWFSELPFLTAIQAQAAFARRENVNFLSSGFNNPSTGSGGSGYFAANGKSEYTFTDSVTQKMYIHTVKKISPKEKRTDIGNIIPPTSYPVIRPTFGQLFKEKLNTPQEGNFTMKLDNLEPYSAIQIDGKASSYHLCNRNLCCHLEVEVDVDIAINPSYVYNFVAFNGVRGHSQVASTGAQICAVVRCTTQDKKTCGDIDYNLYQSHFFKYIKIEANFSSNHTNQYPNTLMAGDKSSNIFDVIPNENYVFDVNQIDNINNVVMEMRIDGSNTMELITFGIFGRDFSKDGQPPTSGMTSNPTINM